MNAPEELGGCNICNPVVAENLARDGFLFHPISRSKKDYLFRDDVLIDYSCPRCSSRARLRTFEMIMRDSRHFRIGDRRALVVSSGRLERKIVAASGYVIDHISLHGNHGDDHCRVGVDVCNMAEISASEFDFTLAINVFDYIPTIDAAFVEVRRVLRPNGWFLFFIQSQRLVEGAGPPSIKHYNALAHESYAAKGEQTGIPDCLFGIEWLKSTAEQRRLKLITRTVLDPLSRIPVNWFVAQAV